MTARKDKPSPTPRETQAKNPECDTAGDGTGRSAGKAAAASERFVKDLEVRGEAVKPSKSGKLPPGATHAVVEENPDGTAKEVKRARFKAF